MAATALNLLPAVRSLQRRKGLLHLPRVVPIQFEPGLPKNIARIVTRRLQKAAKVVRFEPAAKHGNQNTPALRVIRTELKPIHDEVYELIISNSGVKIHFRTEGGLHAAVATLRQLLREHGRQLPCLTIRDWPDFPRRGVMLDISRGRVPKLETLLDLAEHLADFKINELQLYIEHTFAYRRYRTVWRDWSALTGAQIRKLAARCRELGIDLVPNQNSFGHLREFLAHPPLKKLSEVAAPYASDTGDFVRYPSTLAPNYSGTLPFLRGLYDELLPNFSSRFFNVGCDETWDLGRGRSKALCTRLGKGRVYFEFVKKIHHEATKRGKTMMFWGDIILRYPKLIRELPKDLIALNWGYEAAHPFDRESAKFARSKIPFYICPGTSTWMTLIGRHDNAFANLRAAARAGRKYGAIGYLITDWGDGGHPQPLAASWLPFIFGASLAWNEMGYDERKLVPVSSREVFRDNSGNIASAALALGLAHRKFGYRETNQTPFGTVIAAPPAERGEMFCRNGLKCYAHIPANKIRAALSEVERALKVLNRARPRGVTPKLLKLELELAARMAAESCHIMLWQQALASERTIKARKMALRGLRWLARLEQEFNRYWPERNLGTTRKCSPFIKWRMKDYRGGKLAFAPAAAHVQHPKQSPAE